MDKELEYLKLFLKDFVVKGKYYPESFIVNKEQIDDFYQLLKMDLPIIETYDTFEITNEDIIIHHVSTESRNLIVTGKQCCSYSPNRIELTPPEIFSLTSFKSSEYYQKMLEKVGLEYNELKEAATKYQMMKRMLDSNVDIKKIKNGYIIDNEYFEKLEDYYRM